MLGAGELAKGAIPQRDVAGDAHRPGDAAGGVAYRRHHQRDLHGHAVLGLACHFEHGNGLAAAHRFEQVLLARKVLQRKMVGELLSDRIVRVVAEDLFGVAVPEGDGAVDVLGHDGHFGGAGDGLEHASLGAVGVLGAEVLELRDPDAGLGAERRASSRSSL